MKTITVIAACLVLGGCYQNLSMGSCKQEDATHHTVYDFGGITWCRTGGGNQTASSHWLD